jgi:hypothetical protein
MRLWSCASAKTDFLEKKILALRPRRGLTYQWKRLTQKICEYRCEGWQLKCPCDRRQAEVLVRRDPWWVSGGPRILRWRPLGLLRTVRPCVPGSASNILTIDRSSKINPICFFGTIFTTQFGCFGGPANRPAGTKSDECCAGRSTVHLVTSDWFTSSHLASLIGFDVDACDSPKGGFKIATYVYAR